MQAKLAFELAVNIMPVQNILTQFGISKSDLKSLLQDHAFRNMVAQFKQEWNSATSAKDRVRLKAAVMVEENLLHLNDIFRDMDINPTSRLEAFKQMVVLADHAPKKDAAESGPKFNLTLNFGGDKSVTIDADAVIEDADASD